MKQNFDHIRTSIIRRYRRQIIFGLHLSLFVFWFAVLGWWVITREPVPGDMQHMWLMAAWFAAVIAHGFIVRVANARDREIESAWERMYGEVSPSADKPKHSLVEEDDLVPLSYESGRVQDVDFMEKPKQHG
jgi:hypothetical protein